VGPRTRVSPGTSSRCYGAARRRSSRSPGQSPADRSTGSVDVGVQRHQHARDLIAHRRGVTVTSYVDRHEGDQVTRYLFATGGQESSQCTAHRRHNEISDRGPVILRGDASRRRGECAYGDTPSPPAARPLNDVRRASKIEGWLAPSFAFDPATAHAHDRAYDVEHSGQPRRHDAHGERRLGAQIDEDLRARTTSNSTPTRFA